MKTKYNPWEDTSCHFYHISDLLASFKVHGVSIYDGASFVSCWELTTYKAGQAEKFAIIGVLLISDVDIMPQTFKILVCGEKIMLVGRLLIG